MIADHVLLFELLSRSLSLYIYPFFFIRRVRASRVPAGETRIRPSHYTWIEGEAIAVVPSLPDSREHSGMSRGQFQFGLLFRNYPALGTNKKRIEWVMEWGAQRLWEKWQVGSDQSFCVFKLETKVVWLIQVESRFRWQDYELTRQASLASGKATTNLGRRGRSECKRTASTAFSIRLLLKSV